MTKIAISILFILAINYNAFAMTISGVSTDSSSITITGSDFGSGDSTPIIYDDFETGINGNDLDASPQIGTWDLNNTPTPKYSNAHHRSGSMCSLGTANSGDIFTQFGVPSSGDMTDTYYYFSWWGKHYNPAETSGVVKLIQLWGTYQVGDFNPGFFAGPGSSAYVALENSGITQQEWPSYPSQSEWHFNELILKQSTVNTADGSISWIVDGTLLYEKANIKTRERAGESWQKFYIYEGMVNQSGTLTGRYLAIDDIYGNNSWTRVEIIQGSLIEIQPVTGWGNELITTSYKRGNLVDGSAVLRVYDSTGSYDDYDITIGSAPSGSTTATLKNCILRNYTQS